MSELLPIYGLILLGGTRSSTLYLHICKLTKGRDGQLYWTCILVHPDINIFNLINILYNKDKAGIRMAFAQANRLVQEHSLYFIGYRNRDRDTASANGNLNANGGYPFYQFPLKRMGVIK